MTATPKRILVVEDERPLSHALQLKLAHEGFDVVVAADGSAGIEQLSKQHFDAVLLDLIMPGVDGFQVLEHIKTVSKRPKAIFVLSNLSQHEDEKRAMDLGADKFFIKSDIALVDLIKEIDAATTGA